MKTKPKKRKKEIQRRKKGKEDYDSLPCGRGKITTCSCIVLMLIILT